LAQATLSPFFPGVEFWRKFQYFYHNQLCIILKKFPGMLKSPEKLFPLPLNNPGNFFPGLGCLVIPVHLFIQRQAFHEPHFLQGRNGSAHCGSCDTASLPAPGLWPGRG
jgi:hypothetical protein